MGFDAPLEGLEPSHPAPEAGALSPELQGQISSTARIPDIPISICSKVFKYINFIFYLANGLTTLFKN